jgi:hypothetical protein
MARMPRIFLGTSALISIVISVIVSCISFDCDCIF